MSFPDCAAVNVHVPAFSMVTVSVDTVQTEVVPEVNVMSKPELADGATANALADHERSIGSANVMV